MQAATIVAPALGGLLYALGTHWVYGPAVLLYGCALSLMLSLPARQLPLKQKVSLDSLLAGFRFIRSRPAMFGAVSMDMPAVLIGGVGAILVTGLWIRLFPELAKRDHMHPQGPERASN